eukprot:6341005-Pyramimonas_sp.AAC.1
MSASTGALGPHHRRGEDHHGLQPQPRGGADDEESVPVHRPGDQSRGLGQRPLVEGPRHPREDHP